MNVEKVMLDIINQTPYKDFVDLLNDKTYTTDKNLSFHLKSAKERFFEANHYTIKEEKSGESFQLEFALDMQKNECYLRKITNSYVVHKNNNDIEYTINVNLIFNEEGNTGFLVSAVQDFDDNIDYTGIAYIDDQYHKKSESLISKRVRKDSVMYKYDNLFNQLNKINNPEITEIIFNSFLYKKTLTKEDFEFIQITSDVDLDMSFIDKTIKPAIYKIK